MLTAPVLVLNTERINEIDPRNVESLFGMWTGRSNPSSKHGSSADRGSFLKVRHYYTRREAIRKHELASMGT